MPYVMMLVVCVIAIVKKFINVYTLALGCSKRLLLRIVFGKRATVSRCMMIHWIHWFLEHRVWLLKLLVRDAYACRWNIAVDCGDV